MVDTVSENSLRETFASAEFATLVERLRVDPARLTSPVSQAMLYNLSRAVAPANILEIGSYFGNTSRVLAQSVADAGAGSLVTIDPFGGDRLPGIIAAWPSALSGVTTFHPLNSMSYFASLEVVRTPTGKDAPFNMVFVDGHHSYEYALFDILSSALYLRPGGAIVVDNIEQAGPAMAVDTFLSRYRGWKLFSQSGKALDRNYPESVPGSLGAILLGPAGLEVCRIPYKFHFYRLDRKAVSVVRLPLLPTGVTGTLSASANLYSTPYDLHITGVGMVTKVVSVTKRIGGHEPATDIYFGPELAITPYTDQAQTTLEMELRFEPDDPNAANIIVDVGRDMELL
jgi:predicted O-methyltransferase YrrM